jgi:hypothetical protein
MATHIKKLVSALVILVLAAGCLCAQEPKIIIAVHGNVRDMGKILFADSNKIVIWKSAERYAADKVNEYAVRLRPFEIDHILIQRDVHFWSKVGTGFLIGAGVGVVIGLVSGNDNSGLIRLSAGTKAAILGTSLGVTGAMVGGVVAAAQGINDDLFLNRSRERYLKVLPELRKNAMFEFAPPPELQDFLAREPSGQSAGVAAQEKVEPPEAPISRFHLSVSGAILIAGGASGDITSAFNSSGFGGTVGGLFGPTNYPVQEGSPLSWNISGEYSLTGNFRLGLSWSSIPNPDIEGKDFESENAHGNSYSVLCTYVFSPANPLLALPFEFAVSAGLSYNSQYVDGSIYPFGYPNPGPSFHERKNTLGFQLQASCDYYFSRHISLQSKVGENFIPSSVDVPEVEYTGPYGGESIILMAHSVNFSGLDLSVGIRYHF